ncbi:MAG: BtpA/SgcQ family protein [Candidatus Krumholzibacteria bacterium]|nr:BtpA/SgcQ family protein [Candidatus Krumholzibacteria bacterium]
MWTRSDFHQLIEPAAVGMIHLHALPGSPRWGGNMEAVVTAALVDAEALVGGGLNAVMIENYHDIPFFSGRVPAETVAAMTVLVQAVSTAFPGLMTGVNVLRNDVESALGIAAATGARFVRVNIHTGTAVTDQGTIEGRAWNTLRRRRELGIDVGILADVRVKHSRPLVERPLVEEVRDLRLRGLADGVIVTGVATGAGTDPAEVATVREAVPDCPVLVGSGATPATVGDFLPHADGFIVGSSLQEAAPGNGHARVSRARTSEFVKALKEAARKEDRR